MSSSPRIPDSALDAIDRLFGDQFASGAAPSAAWGVFDRGGLVRTGAAGALEGGAVPDEHTAYRIASCTKSFTAAAVLALRDEGALSLDDPITRFVPEFAAVALPTADSPIPTLRMLLTMSAGVPTDDPWGDRQEAMTPPELEALLRAGLRFDSVPGTRFAYSNLGYALLGQVIEAASGRGYREFVLERFLAPLGLSETAFEVDGYEPATVAVGARLLDGRWEYLPLSGPGIFSPIGGLFSTVSDLARWAGWMASAFDDSVEGAPGAPGAPDAADGAHAAGDAAAASPLSRASRRELQQAYRFVPERVEHPVSYGFGFFVDHYEGHGPVVSHSGGYPGFSAHMRWSPALGLGVIGFENATYSRVPVITEKAFDTLLAAVPREPFAELWPETRAAQVAVTALIGSWSDDSARALCSENVELDLPFPQRRAALDAAIARIGGLTQAEVTDDATVAPSQLSWFMAGVTGRLRVRIQLTPENPPRVQSLWVTALAPASSPGVA